MIKQVSKYISLFVSLLIVVLVLSGCSASKFIPEGKFLLDDAEIKSDVKDVNPDRLKAYIRQKGNSKWFSLFKIPLGTYALSGKDSTKWINKKLRDLGEDPVLFDSLQTAMTCYDLENVLHGLGYLRATVDYNLDFKKKKKVVVVYNLHPGPLYHISSVSYDIQDDKIAEFLNTGEGGGFESGLRVGMPFLTNELDNERKALTKYLNNNGYYKFHKDFITYSADSVQGSTDVGLTLHLHKYAANSKSPEEAHTRYKINDVTYYSNDERNYVPLRQSVLEENTLIEPGEYFNSEALQKTYNRFSRLQIVKYTNIRFNELPDSDKLNCDVGISTNKINSIILQPEGTNTAGDFGAAASLTYENKNLFKGAETFSVKLRGAFEAITGLEGYQNQDYEEYSLETKLVFPRLLVPFLSKNFKRQSAAVTELTASYNMQNRPEFHRRVFSAGVRYRWDDVRRRYNVDLIDLNYIYMPWISKTFKEEYLDDVDSRNSILRYNYEDLFIMKLGFGMSYNNGDEAYKFNIETAGNLLNGVSRLIGNSVNSDNQYTLFNIAFAQYVKGDFDYTRMFRFDSRNNLAFHVGFGIAYPYGNSRVLPFEKRYFSGGANSVRGWSVRGLGPGKFKGTNGSIDFINQTGDIKLDINLEFRSFLFWKIYGAVFVDAGNIWTLRYYEEQPGGQFDIKDFYKQIAVAYGVGLRLNFDFFILRFDMGMKAINPAYDTQQEHYAIFHPDFSRDFAFHFAVGLPF